MKAKMFIAAAMLLVSSASFAQFSNSSSSSSANTDGWSTLYLQWNPSTLSPDKGDSESFTGFSIGFNKAFSISQSIPLFVEAGLGLQYSMKNDVNLGIDIDDYDDYDYGRRAGSYYDDYYDRYADELEKGKGDWSMLSAKIPVSLAYDFQIPNSTISIIPYAGLDFRFNIFGKFKPKEGDSANLFDKDDMGGSDATWNRFQIGWHIGVNARFNNKFLVGASYGTDFSEIAEKVKVNTASITLGYCF